MFKFSNKDTRTTSINVLVSKRFVALICLLQPWNLTSTFGIADVNADTFWQPQHFGAAYFGAFCSFYLVWRRRKILFPIKCFAIIIKLYLHPFNLCLFLLHNNFLLLVFFFAREYFIRSYVSRVQKEMI